jgi:hypothetical protein
MSCRRSIRYRGLSGSKIQRQLEQTKRGLRTRRVSRPPRPGASFLICENLRALNRTPRLVAALCLRLAAPVSGGRCAAVAPSFLLCLLACLLLNFSKGNSARSALAGSTGYKPKTRAKIDFPWPLPCLFNFKTRDAKIPLAKQMRLLKTFSQHPAQTEPSHALAVPPPVSCVERLRFALLGGLRSIHLLQIPRCRLPRSASRQASASPDAAVSRALSQAISLLCWQACVSIQSSRLATAPCQQAVSRAGVFDTTRSASLRIATHGGDDSYCGQFSP